VPAQPEPPLAPATPAERDQRRPRNRSQRQIDESAENKASIVRAAATVFAERGYTQTTLDMVASLVGLSRQGVLHHFASKEALFKAVLELQRDWAAGLIENEVRPSGWESIRDLAVFLGRTAQDRPPLQLVHVLEGESIAGNEAAHGYVRERVDLIHAALRRRLERLRAEGAIAPDVDLDTLATLIAAAINGLQKRWLVDPRAKTSPAFDLLLTLIENQLTPEH
jgi:AcrR family transcriptional regulator